MGILATNWQKTLGAAPPTAPDQLTVGNQTSSSVELNWLDSSPSATGYRIQRSDNGQDFSIYQSYPRGQISGDPNDGALIHFTDSGGITFTDSGLPDGTRYWYRVRAYGNGYDTAYTPKVGGTTVLPAPSNLAAEWISSHDVKLTWTDNSSDENGFIVEYRPQGGDWTALPQTIARDATQCSVGGLDDSLDTDFRIKAFGEAGESSYATVTALHQAQAQEQGTWATVTPMGHDSVVVRWTDNSTVETGWLVERNYNGTWTTVGLLAQDAEQFSNSYLPAATRYSYRVCWFNKEKFSPYSNVTSCTTDATPSPSLNLSAQATGPDQATLSWNSGVVNVSSYVIYRAKYLPRGGGQVGPYEEIARLEPSATSYVAGGLEEGGSYTFRIDALRNDPDAGVYVFRSSPPSNTVAMAPAAPSNLSAMVNPSTVNLTWSDDSQNNGGYVVRVFYDNGVKFREDNLPSGNVTQYTVNGLNPESTYQVEVAAYSVMTDSPGRRYSSPSVRRTVTMPAYNPSLPPPTPVSVAFNNGNHSNETNTSTAQLVVSRPYSTADALPVGLYVSGQAQAGVDYQALPSPIVIPAGQSQVQVPITGISDNLVEGDEDIFISVAGSGSVYPAASGGIVGWINDNGPRVTSVAWEAVPATPLDINRHLGGGWSIFPDKNSPTDTTAHDLVDVVVSVSPSTPAGTTVYLKAFDVDDPNVDADLKLDPDDLVGSILVPQGNDNFGTSPNKRGAFTESGTNTVSAVTDSNHKARVRFQVTMQPGDNFRVAATLSEAELDRLSDQYDPDASPAKSLVPSGKQQFTSMEFGGALTDMLTVWRKVNVNVDSNNDGTIDDQDDAIEEDPDKPGVIISVNDDDDDNNGVADMDQEGTVPGEDDLVELKLTVPQGVAGTVELTIPSGADKVRLYQTSDRSLPLTSTTWQAGQQPHSVWAEGIDPSTALADITFALAFQATGATQLATDAARATVQGAQIQLAAGQADIGDFVTSVLGEGHDLHFVTPKAAGQSVTLQATRIPAGMQMGQDVVWHVNGVVNNGVTGHPDQVRIARDATGKTVVQLWDVKRNVAIKTTDVWVVWATGGKAPDSPAPQVGVGQGQQMPQNKDRHNPPQDGPGSWSEMNSSWLFQFEIEPKAILSDNDRPNFDAPPVRNLQGTDIIRNADLNGGIRARWDVSRRVRVKAFSPNTGHEWYAGDLPYPLLSGPIANGDTKADYPADDWVGNDDAATTDESPLLENGILKSADQVRFPVVRWAGGQAGDTIEWRFQFGEFLRLQIGQRWYRVSNFVDWRYHALLKHNGVNWQPNGGVTDLTNDGW